ncbi:unnamed protein product [Oppiella nova]|uniref:C2 domain-containing protein n=1 Tax=Oppiella nova TaxID=334625 RepID=A0A7R9QW97_9ACAR|nr:unnamed protein product [Oppiella nova]CAG2177414.1 unnamed protein product [Oppiella nova]
MIDLMQKNFKQFIGLGFNLYKVEVNRNFKIHNLNRIPIVFTSETTKSRNVFKRIELSSGRYALTPICSDPELELILRVFTNKSTNLKVLSQDMPRENLLPFVSPKYPKFVTRITIISANILERQDIFGCNYFDLDNSYFAANPYCVFRCGRQVVKSSPIHETLNPEWDYFSAIFYHNKFISINVELWHHNLLIDYFMGRVEVLPKINTNAENLTSIQELELFSRKKERKVTGSVKLQVFTYENLLLL